MAGEEGVEESLVSAVAKIANRRKNDIERIAKQGYPILTQEVSSILGKDESWVKEALGYRAPESPQLGPLKRRRAKVGESGERGTVAPVSGAEPDGADLLSSPLPLGPLTPFEEYDTEADLQRVSAILGAEGVLV